MKTLTFLHPIALMLAFTLAFAACSSEMLLSVEQKQQAEQMSNEIDMLSANVNALGESNDNLVQEIQDKISRGEDVSVELSTLQTQQEQYDSALSSLNSKIEAQNEFYAGIASGGAAQGLVGVIRSIPGIGGFAELLIPLLAFAFPRPRQTLKNTVKGVRKGQWWQILLMLPKMAGLLHTNAMTAQVAKEGLPLTETTK